MAMLQCGWHMSPYLLVFLFLGPIVNGLEKFENANGSSAIKRTTWTMWSSSVYSEVDTQMQESRARMFNRQPYADQCNSDHLPKSNFIAWSYYKAVQVPAAAIGPAERHAWMFRTLRFENMCPGFQTQDFQCAKEDQELKARLTSSTLAPTMTLKTGTPGADMNCTLRDLTLFVDDSGQLAVRLDYTGCQTLKPANLKEATVLLGLEVVPDVAVNINKTYAEEINFAGFFMDVCGDGALPADTKAAEFMISLVANGFEPFGTLSDGSKSWGKCLGTQADMQLVSSSCFPDPFMVFTLQKPGGALSKIPVSAADYAMLTTLMGDPTKVPKGAQQWRARGSPQIAPGVRRLEQSQRRLQLERSERHINPVPGEVVTDRLCVEFMACECFNGCGKEVVDVIQYNPIPLPYHAPPTCTMCTVPDAVLISLLAVIAVLMTCCCFPKYVESFTGEKRTNVTRSMKSELSTTSGDMQERDNSGYDRANEPRFKRSSGELCIWCTWIFPLGLGLWLTAFAFVNLNWNFYHIFGRLLFHWPHICPCSPSWIIYTVVIWLCCHLSAVQVMDWATYPEFKTSIKKVQVVEYRPRPENECTTM